MPCKLFSFVQWKENEHEKREKTNWASYNGRTNQTFFDWNAKKKI